jgi:hypothetical protein
MRCSDHNNKNHDHGGGTHDAQWVVDPVLARDLAAEVEDCRLPHAHPAPAPAPAPAPNAPLTANPGLGLIIGVGLPVLPALAPAPPSREKDEGDNRIVEVTGHPLREEVFEVLEEVFDDLAGRGLNDELEVLKTSLIDLRRACVIRDLLAVVQALIALSESPEHQRMLLVM